MNPEMTPEEAACQAVITADPDVWRTQLVLVWFSYTLGNWKALIAAPTVNAKYYEVIYNVAKNEIYVDTYVKESNRVVQP